MPATAVADEIAARGTKRPNANAMLREDVAGLRALLAAAVDRIAVLETKLAVVAAHVKVDIA